VSDPNEFHLRLSPFLRKKIKRIAEQMHFYGYAENPHMSSFLRSAAIEKIERAEVQIEESKRRLKSAD